VNHDGRRGHSSGKRRPHRLQAQVTEARPGDAGDGYGDTECNLITAYKIQMLLNGKFSGEFSIYLHNFLANDCIQVEYSDMKSCTFFFS
jgi:hypothetical protein